MYWTTTTQTMLLLHELAHMNTRARSRHRTAAASRSGDSRAAHEQAASRHGAFAEALAARLIRLGAHHAARVSLRAASDAGNAMDAEVLLERGRTRMMAVYAEAIASPLDADTRQMLASQLEVLRYEGRLSLCGVGALA